MRNKEPFARQRYDTAVKRQSIAAMDSMLQELESTLRALNVLVEAEEARTRISDSKNVAYSTAAVSARLRSQNLEKSILELRARLAIGREEHRNALANLSALERAAGSASSELASD